MIRRLLWILTGLGAAAAAGVLLLRRGGLELPGVSKRPKGDPRGGPGRVPAQPAEPVEVPEAGSEQARVLPGPGVRPPKQGAVRRGEAAKAAETETAEEPTQCAGITRNGERCSRPADAGSRFCWQHRED